MRESDTKVAKVILILLLLIVFISLAVFSLLMLASFFITAAYPYYTESVEYLSATLVPVVVGFFIYIGFFFLLRRITPVECNVTIIALIVFIILFIGSITWSILANTFPSFDSLDLIYAAKELGSGRIGHWAPGCYMERFPYQTYYVLLIRLCWRVFGDEQLYLSLELINAICSAAAGFLIVKLSCRLFSSRAALGTGFATTLFLPFIFYSTFAYGNIPSIPFAIGAIYLEVVGLQTNKIRYLALSALSITASIMLKSTIQVVLIAMLIIGVLYLAWKRKRVWTVGYAAVLLISSIILPKIVDYAVAERYGVVLDNGLPKTAWVAEGLGDIAQYPEVSNRPGIFTGFIWNWQDEYDTEIANADSLKSINSSISQFINDPGYALRFFLKKIGWMWLEPTYSMLLNGNWSVSPVADQQAMADRPMTPILHSIYYGSLHHIIILICDVSQSALLLFSVCFLVRSIKGTQPLQLLPMLACLGFFAIYLDWEAKSQYVLPAYALMLIYSGPALEFAYHTIAENVSSVWSTWNKKKDSANV